MIGYWVIYCNKVCVEVNVLMRLRCELCTRLNDEKNRIYYKKILNCFNNNVMSHFLYKCMHSYSENYHQKKLNNFKSLRTKNECHWSEKNFKIYEKHIFNINLKIFLQNNIYAINIFSFILFLKKS